MEIDSLMSSVLLGTSLLLLSVSSNFVGETLGCQLQKHLSKNMGLKHTLILFIIYFSIGLSKDVLHPIVRIFITCIIWILFLCINRMPIYTTCIIFVLLFLATFIRTIEEYDETLVPENVWNSLYIIIMSCIVLMTCVGVVVYFRKKYREYRNTWSIYTFVFGTPLCKHNGEQKA